jgi:ketosteroid isomerase-like protein
MSQENVEIVRRAFDEFQEGLARGDPASLFDSGLTDPEAERILPPNSPGFQQVYRGREGFLEFMRTWTEDFDWSIELERASTQATTVSSRCSTSARPERRGGVPVELHMALVYELQDGRIIRMRNFLNPTEAIEAAGLRE